MLLDFNFACETFDSDACSKKNWNKKINKNTNKSCCGYFSLSPRTLYCFSANPRNEISAEIFRSPFLLEISNSNHAVPRAIWETFSEFLIFWNMFNELSYVCLMSFQKCLMSFQANGTTVEYQKQGKHVSYCTRLSCND